MEYTLVIQNYIGVQKYLDMYINIDENGKVIDFYLYKTDFKIYPSRVLPSCKVIAEHIILNKRTFIEVIESKNPIFIRLNCSFEKFCKVMRKDGYNFYLSEIDVQIFNSLKKYNIILTK